MKNLNKLLKNKNIEDMGIEELNQVIGQLQNISKDALLTAIKSKVKENQLLNCLGKLEGLSERVPTGIKSTIKNFLFSYYRYRETDDFEYRHPCEEAVALGDAITSLLDEEKLKALKKNEYLQIFKCDEKLVQDFIDNIDLTQYKTEKRVCYIPLSDFNSIYKLFEVEVLEKSNKMQLFFANFSQIFTPKMFLKELLESPLQHRNLVVEVEEPDEYDPMLWGLRLWAVRESM